MSHNIDNSRNLHHHIESDHALLSGRYIKNIVYGGLDGIITTFSIIAAAYGVGFEIKLIIIMGIANLIADGFSMGLGDFFSSYFENLYILSEKAKEDYEYIHNKEYEVNEMVELYENQGLEREDAQKIVDIIANPKYQEYFIKTMVNYELGLEIPEEGYTKQNIKEGSITCGSFISFGFIPVLPYIIFYSSGYDHYTNIFIIDCFITSIAMFFLGFTQAKITKQPKFKYGTIMCFNGSLAALCAFLVGFGLEKALSE